MKKIVVDTNIVFSALLNVNSRIGQILINGNFNFYAPEYLRYEIIEHQLKIKTLAKLSDDEFVELYELIMRNIHILNHNIIPVKFYKNAAKLCEDIDVNDTVFIAFTEYLKGKLWTGDKKLIKGLMLKGFKTMVNTDELYQDFVRKS